MNTLGSGARKNAEKVRYDLLESFATEQVARVFTKGQRKYPDPPHNWLYGMSWNKCHASALRHAAAWARGEDYDIDKNCPECQQALASPDWKSLDNWVCKNHTGELHSALAAWNWLALTSYVKWFPQGDNRMKNVMPKPKVGLDIDEVLCDFIGAWGELWGMGTPHSWFWDRNIVARFDKMRKDGTLNDFYLNLKPLLDPKEIPFEPHCYVTSRPVPTEITIEWLDKHGFPTRPVYTVPAEESKVETIKNAGCDIFVDDRHKNYEELTRNGICCYLYDQPHNRRYDVGYKRIKSLKELNF